MLSSALSSPSLLSQLLYITNSLILLLYKNICNIYAAFPWNKIKEKSFTSYLFRRKRNIIFTRITIRLTSTTTTSQPKILDCFRSSSACSSVFLLLSSHLLSVSQATYNTMYDTVPLRLLLRSGMNMEDYYYDYGYYSYASTTSVIFVKATENLKFKS